MEQSGLPPSLEMKMQAKMYEAEARRYNKEAAKERKKAKAALRMGDRAAATIHAQNVIRNENHADDIIKAASANINFALLMQEAEVTKKTANALDTTQNEMNKVVGDIDFEKLAENRQKLDGLKLKIQNLNELLKDNDDELIPYADDILAALEAEILADSMIELDQIPIADKSHIKTKGDKEEKK